ncbi:unnamed protein product [Rhizophagus irregularis]|nr:unnamed protein product [Rhizophagus irregularis]
MEVIVGLLKDRIDVEKEPADEEANGLKDMYANRNRLLKQCITEFEAEFKAKNSEIPELRKKLAKFEVRDVKIQSLERRL